MSDVVSTAIPGATYKFTVRSTDEAVRTIRERLGANAKVLSVRQIPAQGLGGIFGKPKIEVIAQMDSESGVNSGSFGVSAEPANPFDESAEAITFGSPASEQVHARNIPSTRPGTAARRDTLPRLPDLLRRSGFSETTLSRLLNTPAFPADDQRPLHHALVEVGQQLRKQAAARRARPLPARSAFLGTPGVGRTTALCKWLAKEVFTHQRVGRVLKAEFDRPNPAEGLAVFCEALGLNLEYYAPENLELPSTFGGPPGEFLYADLPGISLSHPAENASITKFLEREKFTGRVLVLNCAYDASLLRRTYAVGSDLGATHVVFTHLDEVEQWGKLWDFLLEGELSPLFLATGPSLTGDCEEDAATTVLRKTLPGA